MKSATVVLVCLIVAVACFPTVQEIYEARNKVLSERFGLHTEEERRTWRDPDRSMFLTDYNAYLPNWNCPPLQPQPTATNVRQLRPQDIKVIAAMGDSISAGFLMQDEHWWEDIKPWEILEFRLDVFSIGGNESNVYTLPYYFNKYQAGLVGAATGTTFPVDLNTILQPTHAKLNAAISGAHVEDLFSQVDYIVSQLKSDRYRFQVDFNNDWKLITLFVGADNICSACHNTTTSQPEYMGSQLDAVLSQIQQQIPRVFVNVLPLFNISQVYTVTQGSEYCRAMWNTVAHSECQCLTDNATPQGLLMMDDNTVAWNQQIYEVVAQWQAKNLPTFWVSIQPFTENLIIPDIQFINGADCFHPDFLANNWLAVQLWNSMMLPPNLKPTNVSWTPQTYICPTISTYLQ